MFRSLYALPITALLIATAASAANSWPVGELRIDQPWSQALPPNAPAVAAYFVIDNAGHDQDRLVSVDTPIAGTTQLHQHVHENGMMKMRQVDAVTVPAGGQFTFAPMVNHVMLLDIKDRALLAEGQHFPLTLHFEHAGAVTVEVDVRSAAPTKP